MLPSAATAEKSPGMDASGNPTKVQTQAQSGAGQGGNTGLVKSGASKAVKVSCRAKAT